MVTTAADYSLSVAGQKAAPRRGERGLLLSLGGPGVFQEDQAADGAAGLLHLRRQVADAGGVRAGEGLLQRPDLAHHTLCQRSRYLAVGPLQIPLDQVEYLARRSSGLDQIALYEVLRGAALRL